MSIGTDPLFTIDFNNLNTPSFEGTLHIEIVLSLFCLSLKSLIFVFFYIFCTDIDLLLIAKFLFSRGDQIRKFKGQ